MQHGENMIGTTQTYKHQDTTQPSKQPIPDIEFDFVSQISNSLHATQPGPGLISSRCDRPMAEDSPEEKQSLESDRDDVQRLKEIMRNLAA